MQGSPLQGFDAMHRSEVIMFVEREVSAWARLTKAGRMDIRLRFEGIPYPTGLRCHKCLTYGHDRLALVDGRMVCEV